MGNGAPLFPSPPNRQGDPVLKFSTDSIEPSLFRQQFRFAKVDFDYLCSAFLVPETVKNEQNVTVPGREAFCIALPTPCLPEQVVQSRTDIRQAFVCNAELGDASDSPHRRQLQASVK